MATTRKRTSGFSEKPAEESTEQKEVEQMLDTLVQETFEEVSKKEEVVPAFVAQEIIPTEDAGPRFIEPEVIPPPVTPAQPTPQLKAPPKRHPRNIPKFSRFK